MHLFSRSSRFVLLALVGFSLTFLHAHIAAAAYPTCLEAASTVVGASKVKAAKCVPSASDCTQASGFEHVDAITSTCNGANNEYPDSACCFQVDENALLTCAEAASDKLGQDKVGSTSCQPTCASPAVEVVSVTSDCQAPNKCCAVAIASAGTTKGSSGSATTLDNPLGTASVYDVIRTLIKAFLGIVGSLALAMFVYAGVLWMTAGDSKRVQTAKDTMKYAVLGLAVIAFAYSMTTFVLNAFLGTLAK